MLLTSAACTRVEWVNASLRFLDFFVRIWLLKACFLLILPEPVSLKRFLVLDFVFILGILFLFMGYLAYYLLGRMWPPLYIMEYVYLFFRFGSQEHGHSFALQFWHLLHLSQLLEFGGQFKQQDFPLVFVDNGPALKEYICLQLGSFF